MLSTGIEEKRGGLGVLVFSASPSKAGGKDDGGPRAALAAGGDKRAEGRE